MRYLTTFLSCASFLLGMQTTPTMQAQNSDSLLVLLRTVRQKGANDTLSLLAVCRAIQDLALVKPDTTILYGQGIVSTSEQIHFDLGVIRGCRSLCLAYFIKGRYEEAFQAGLRSVKLAEQLNFSREKALSEAHLALVYYALGNYAESAKLSSDAQKIMREQVQNTRADSLMLMEVDILSIYPFADAGREAESIRYGREGIALARRLQERYWTWVGVGILADYAASVENTEEAIRLSRESLTEARKHGATYFQSLFLRNIGLMESSRGRYEQAIRYYLESIDLGLREGMRMELPNVYDELATAYSEIDDIEKAFYWEQRSKQLQDSVYTEKGALQIAQMRTHYETEKIENQVQSLQSQEQARKTLIYAVSGGLVLSAIALAATVVAYRRKRKSEEALQEKNEEFLSLNKQLRALNAEKDEFMGIAAHDLRNPIGGIRSLAMLLEGAQHLAPEKVQSVGGMVRTSSDAMLTLIGNLLNVNELERGQAYSSPETFNIASLIQNITDDYSDRAAAKQITLHSIEDTDAQVVYADRLACLQIFDNIVSNAVKYSPHGKNIWIDVYGAEGKVRVAVKDEGAGLSEEDKQRLFGKFARLSTMPTGGEQRTGLGLSIVKRLVESQGGTVWCESEFGKGATFFIELPSTPSSSGV